jgi:excisionase family DNA binding protein
MSIQNHGDILQNEVLTVREVAAYLRVSRVTVWRWCRQGTIPASRVGRNWRIRREDLLRLLETIQSPNPHSVRLDPSIEQYDPSQVTPAVGSEDEEAVDITQDDPGSGPDE